MLINKFDLTKDTFILFAAKNYNNPYCKGMKEFNEDLKRFKYLKRLFNSYKKRGSLKERLIINHIIVLVNLFGPEATTKMLFFKLEQEFWPELKTFLLFLNLMPDNVEIYGAKQSSIPIDLQIAKVLRAL